MREYGAAPVRKYTDQNAKICRPLQGTSAGQVRFLIGSHKVSYAKFLVTFERTARPRGPAAVLASSPVGGRRREPSK